MSGGWQTQGGVEFNISHAQKGRESLNFTVCLMFERGSERWHNVENIREDYVPLVAQKIANVLETQVTYSVSLGPEEGERAERNDNFKPLKSEIQ